MAESRADGAIPNDPATAGRGANLRTQLIAAGGIGAALAASSCCVIPFALFSAGITGAWIGNLTALAAYQPYIAGVALSFLAIGFYRVYRRPAADGCDGSYCASPRSRRIAKGALFVATGVIAVALAWPTLLPLLVEPVVVLESKT
jgi:mercuric ion transport protein